MSANPNSVNGAIHDSIKPTRQNHQGKSLGGISQHEKIRTNTGNDSHPEFHVQTLDAGSAPPNKTYQPHPISEIPGQSYPNSSKDTWTYADATLNGSTSQDIYNMPNMGKPLQGQTHADKPKHGQHGYGYQGRPVEVGELSEKETMGFSEDPNRQKAGTTGIRTGKGTLKSEGLMDVGGRQSPSIETRA